MKKEYIELNGTTYKKDGWSKKEYHEFIDKIIELVESYNAQIAITYSMKTEEELMSTIDKDSKPC